MSDAVMIFSSMLIPIRGPSRERRNYCTTNVNGSGINWWDQSLVEWLFETHLETALSVQSHSLELMLNCMNDISHIIRRLGQKRTLSDAKLRRTSVQLARLTQDGIEVEWLWSELKMKKQKAYLERKKREAYLERKKHEAYWEKEETEARIVELKQEVKKLELAKSSLKAKLKNEKAMLNPRSFRNLLGNCFCPKT